MVSELVIRKPHTSEGPTKQGDEKPELVQDEPRNRSGEHQGEAIFERPPRLQPRLTFLPVTPHDDDEPSEPDQEEQRLQTRHHEYRVAEVHDARPDEDYFGQDHEEHKDLQSAFHRSVPPSERRSWSSSMHLFWAGDIAFRTTPENAGSNEPDSPATPPERSLGRGFAGRK